MAPKPYPLQFAPIFQDYRWGGRNLASKLNKPIPQKGIWAESWELVDHLDYQSVVINGELRGKTLRILGQTHGEWLLGRHSPQARFPLLFKYLDCQSDLSVQVHPDDNYALRMSPADLGKTEAWYIVDAIPNALIYAGLKKGVDRETLFHALQRGETVRCLHTLEPKPGDCVFIPAGTVHALGAGLLVAEIQQASNTTFRLFDWNRVDSEGNSRPLHVESAMQTIDFDSGPSSFQTAQPTDQPGRMRLVSCDKFILDSISRTNVAFVGGDGRCHILTVPNGTVELSLDGNVYFLALGETVLLPAAMSAVAVKLDRAAILLDMYLPELA